MRSSENAAAYLLGVQSDNERGNVDHLLSDTDVPLPDENTGVVDRLGETTTSVPSSASASTLSSSPTLGPSDPTPNSPALEDLGLQPPLQEVLDLEGQDVIQPHPRVVEHSDPHESSDQGVTLEETLGVLVVELQELSGGSSDLGEGQLNPPNLTLVTETVLSGELEGSSIAGSVLGLRDWDAL